MALVPSVTAAQGIINVKVMMLSCTGWRVKRESLGQVMLNIGLWLFEVCCLVSLL